MADEPFVDTHIHFFDKSYDGLRWAWLEPGFSFRKWSFDEAIDSPRYTPPEFRAEADGSALPARASRQRIALHRRRNEDGALARRNENRLRRS